MRIAMLAVVGLGTLAGLISGCAGTPDPVKSAAEDQAASTHILANKGRKGALLLVRIYEPGTFSGARCLGWIRLRKVGSGVPDDKAEFVDVGGAGRMFLPDDTETEGKKAGFLNMVPSAQSYEESYVPIAPGRYVITKVQCTMGKTDLEGGYDDGSLFKHVTPFAGESAITIGEGQIVDAGYVHFQGSKLEPSVIASEASTAEREFMKKLIPEVYPAITFTKFGN